MDMAVIEYTLKAFAIIVILWVVIPALALVSAPVLSIFVTVYELGRTLKKQDD